jgi:O-acetyl-ADP-ribose deacetylase (regulator of RNase III)
MTPVRDSVKNKNLKMTEIPQNKFQEKHINKSIVSNRVKEYKIKDCILRLVLGDITEQKVDAIVNAANNHLWMGAGVAGAIKRKGGEIIEQEAMRNGPIEIGEAVVTNAGNLKTKYVIHAAVMNQDLTTVEDKIRLATQNSLKRAEELKLKSITFPALGTGVGGFPKEKCAQIMINEVISHINLKMIIKRFDFILFDQSTFAAFERELNSTIKNFAV